MRELMLRLQLAALVFAAAGLICAAVFWIRKARSVYRSRIVEDYVLLDKKYNDLVTGEGHIYDTQLKYEKRLNEISNLYEITKDLSTSLHFDSIFKILVEYLHKNFMFKKITLMLLSNDVLAAGNELVYEAAGNQERASKAKGVFPRIEPATREPSENDKKIYELLKNDVRRIQITRTEWDQNPYAQYLPKDARTYMASPIIFDGRVIGVLSIEDLSVSDLEKFSILTAQFTLEMRRIILYEKVEEMAITDGLTRAFAKRHITERLIEEFERSERHKFNLAFLMVDIDYFKNYNDTYGHLVGDVVLKEIVALLKANTREVDLVGRFGGEEFCVILPETEKVQATIVAERIRSVIEKHRFKAYDESTSVRVSIGIAVYPEDANDVNALIENSDTALYAAKKEGRNKVSVYNS